MRVWMAALLYGALAWPAAHASAPDEGLAYFARTVSRASDDPRKVIAETLAAGAARAEPEFRFWNGLAQARIRVLLDQTEEAQSALAAAGTLLASSADAQRVHALALEMQRIQVGTLTEEPADLRPRIDKLIAGIDAQRFPTLACDAESLRMWILHEAGALDEAWMSAERAEHCAKANGDPVFEAGVLIQMGTTASVSIWRMRIDRNSIHYFERARALLDSHPARYLRGLLEWELGKALSTQDLPRAIAHFERSRELAREVGDVVGVGIAGAELAIHLLKRGEYARALQIARESRQQFQDAGAPHRVAATYFISIEALTALRDPALRQELQDSLRWELPAVSPTTRSRLAHARAKGYAAQGLHAKAYETLMRAVQLETEARKAGVDRSTMRLQAAYEAAQREAENAKLKLQEESARLQLQAADARQSTLVVAIVALGIAVLAAGAAAFGALRQRRRMADLALSDELTGAPNRRAIVQIARTQWQHCRQLGIPLCVALIDIDHFKKVNDTHGHDAGDAALRALAAASRRSLRLHDRLGRYGGEEWLLVAPGVTAAELPGLFRRLRREFQETPVAGLPHPHGLSFSMGAVVTDASETSPGELISRADAAVYRAKHLGRDRLCIGETCIEPEPPPPPVQPATQPARAPESASTTA